MGNTVKAVDTLVLITFADGRKYNLPLVGDNNTNLQTYGKSVRLKEQSYSTTGKDSIVGNICCNSLSIELVSNDKLLISSNPDSIYSGLMNETAYVDIWCKDSSEAWLYHDASNSYISRADNGDDNKQYFGRYYVSAWENGTTSSTANNVTITCVDLLSKIKNIAFTKIRLRRNMKFKEYIQLIVTELNKNLPETMTVYCDPEDLKNDWKMYFNNIDRDDIETIFNTIAHNTISYIWINRTRHIVADSLLDDSDNDPISYLSGVENVFEYGSQSGDIDSYSGVEVEYIENISYEDKELLSIKDYKLYSNDKNNNKINDATLNSDKVFNVHHIEIKCKKGSAVCTSFNNYKKHIDLNIIKSTETTEADISVFGTVINETTNFITKYKDNNDKNTVIQVKNKVLNKKYIKTYTKWLIQLMRLKNSRVYASGYFNPYIKLGDMVYITGTRLSIGDKYKVVGIELTLGTNYRSKVTLLKTEAGEKDYTEILYDYTNLFQDRLGGEIINTSSFVPLSNEDNNAVIDQIGSDIRAFENRLNGGV